ncbi:MAG: hypothetical protein KBB91_01280 [Candidatus Pacebacteria bacterium]|nr:hypothetical protein [Candidatus Paceibacterota bacterium]
MAMIFATTSFAQMEPSPERPLPIQPQIIVPQQICPAPPVAVFVTQNNNTFAVPGTAAVPETAKRTERIVYRTRLVSGPTFITNNHHYGDTTVTKTLPPPVASSNEGNPSSFNDWLAKLVITACVIGLLLLLLFVLMNWLRRRSPVDSVKSETISHTHTHSHTYPAPKSEPVKPVSDDFKKDALDKAATTGGSFSSRSDGSWKVDFLPKVESVPKESVKEDVKPTGEQPVVQ